MYYIILLYFAFFDFDLNLDFDLNIAKRSQRLTNFIHNNYDKLLKYSNKHVYFY